MNQARIAEIAVECAGVIGDKAHKRSGDDTLYLESTAAGLIASAIRAAVDEVPPTQWVSVNERVPDSRYDLLVLLDSGFWEMGRYDLEARRFESAEGSPLFGLVTHWAEVMLPPGVRGR